MKTQHTILQEAITKQLYHYQEMERLETIIRQCKQIAFKSKDGTYTTLSKDEALNWAEMILYQRGFVNDASDFLQEFQEYGYTVPYNITMVGYLSENDKVYYNKEKCAWLLIGKPEPEERNDDDLPF